MDGRLAPESAAFGAGETRLILVGDTLAGCVALRPAGDALELDEFQLDTARQGSGLGTAVLRAFLAEADAAGKSLVLTRHGFVQTGAEECDLFYRRPVTRA